MDATLRQQPIDPESLIRFYAESGVDAALMEEPLDHLNEADRQRAAPEASVYRGQGGRSSERPQTTKLFSPILSKPQTVPTPLSQHIVPDETQVALAREAASTAHSLDELRERLAAFDGSHLKLTAKNLCFADGDPTSDIMFIGEAPGRNEDIEGRPFVGRSGQLLNQMLMAIGMTRDKVYITNTIPWHPPGNRTPTPFETELFRPFIERQIELVDPKILVALGGPAAKVLTGSTEGILHLRGNWKIHTTLSEKMIPVMPTLHPAFLLRSPAQKRFAWRDFLAVKIKLRELTE